MPSIGSGLAVFGSADESIELSMGSAAGVSMAATTGVAVTVGSAGS